VRAGAGKMPTFSYQRIVSTFVLVAFDRSPMLRPNFSATSLDALATTASMGADSASIRPSNGNGTVDDCCRTNSCAAETPPARVADRAPRQVTDDCCSAKEHEIAALRDGMERVLQIVLAINAAMFVAEFTAGVVAHSSALMADSVDMLGDALVYGMSLYALRKSDRWRAGAALAKGGIIAAFGIGVFAEVVTTILSGISPLAGIMVAFGLIALAANVACLGLLYRYRRHDVNMSSTFECSRNDVIANVGVLAAAGGVYATGVAWPDITVGSIIAVLFFRSAVRVLRQAWPQFRSGVLTAPGAAE
jgi:hypothetical protein